MNMESIIKKDVVRRLPELVEGSKDKPKFHTVIRNEHGEILLVAFDKDVVIPTHHVNCDVLVQVLEGEMIFTIKGEPDKELRMRAGDFVRMEPNTEHSLRGLSPVKITVTKINA